MAPVHESVVFGELRTFRQVRASVPECSPVFSNTVHDLFCMDDQEVFVLVTTVPLLLGAFLHVLRSHETLYIETETKIYTSHMCLDTVTILNGSAH